MSLPASALIDVSAQLCPYRYDCLALQSHGYFFLALSSWPGLPPDMSSWLYFHGHICSAMSLVMSAWLFPLHGFLALPSQACFPRSTLQTHLPNSALKDVCPAQGILKVPLNHNSLLACGFCVRALPHLSCLSPKCQEGVSDLG